MKPVIKVTVLELVGKNFQGLVTLPNLAQTKLRKEDGSTVYSTVSNLRQAAVAAARKYSATLDFVLPKRLAAKRSTRRR